jgi:Fic family protein
MLYLAPELTDRDQAVLAQIDQMRHDLGAVLQRTPTKWTEGLRKSLTADAIAGSNSIEGYRVESSVVEDILDGEEFVDTSQVNKAETQAYQQLMTYIQTLRDFADFRYSKELLNAMHWMLQGHHSRNGRLMGQWRRGGIWINEPFDPREHAYDAPDADQVPGLMAEFIEWLNGGDLDHHMLIRAAMAHLNLVNIHPWSDGNGRMSRSLQTLLIAREGVLAPEFSCIEEWLGEPRHQLRYYAVLSEVGGPVYSPERNTSEWIRFNLTAYHQRAQAVRHRVDRSNECWVALEEFATARGIPERQVTALHDAALAGRVRRSRYQNAECLNAQQATRDMQKLTAAGLLTAIGNTKARHYVPGPHFPPTILNAAGRGLTPSDPYA